MVSEPQDFAGRVALIAGGTQGLGYAVADLLRQRGAHGLVLVGRNVAKGEAAAEEASSLQKRLEELGAAAAQDDADRETLYDWMYVEQLRSNHDSIFRIARRLAKEGGPARDSWLPIFGTELRFHEGVDLGRHRGGGLHAGSRRQVQCRHEERRVLGREEDLRDQAPQLQRSHKGGDDDSKR